MSATVERAEVPAAGVPFVDLRAQTDAVRAPVAADLERLLDEGAFVNGAAVSGFERAFASACGRAECVGVASGLDALRLVLIAAGIEPGDEVVVPAMTFVASFEAVAQAGGVPVPVDVRADDVGLDVAALEAVCTSRTRFVMPVHLYGQLVDVVALHEAAARNGLTVIEDACQAHGARRDGIVAGGLGHAAAFSFYPTKNLGAWGDAGAVVTDDEALAARVRSLREHGQTQRYHADEVGYTARLDALQAVVLTHKLRHLERWNLERARLAAVYSEALAGVGDLQLPTTVSGATHVWHLYTIRTVDPGALAGHLAVHGISTGRHYPQAPHLSPAFASLGYTVGAFPVAEAVARETLSLPLYPGLTPAQQDAVVSVVKSFFVGTTPTAGLVPGKGPGA